MIKIVLKLLYPELAFNLIAFNLREISEDSTVELDPNVILFCREFFFEFYNSIISILGWKRITQTKKKGKLSFLLVFGKKYEFTQQTLVARTVNTKMNNFIQASGSF